MEGDDKEAAAKMVGTSATDHQKEDIDENIFPDSPLESSHFHQLHINEEPSQTETAATSSKKRKQLPLPLPLDSSPNLTPKKIKEEEPSSETPTKRKRGRPPGSGSGSKKEKEGPSRTTSAETPTKRTPDSPSATGGKFTPHVIQFNAGEDVVEVLYKISVANPRQTVAILSANGPISEIVDLTPNGPRQSKGEFHLMSLKWPDDDNGRRSREKTMCTITFTNAVGNMFANTSVNSLIAAGRVGIMAGLLNTDTAMKTGARISAAARNDEKNPIAATPFQIFEANMDPAREGSTSGHLPTTPIVGDGNIISTTSATTSASNDQDMKSPSVGDT